MDVIATAKHVRMSARKARNMVRLLPGLSVSEALKITEFSERKAALAIGKTLKSAIANAQNNNSLSADSLTVKEAVVSEGARLRRFWPRARGGVSPVLKRLCHVKIVLTDGKESQD